MLPQRKPLTHLDSNQHSTSRIQPSRAAKAEPKNYFSSRQRLRSSTNQSDREQFKQSTAKISNVVKKALKTVTFNKENRCHCGCENESGGKPSITRLPVKKNKRILTPLKDRSYMKISPVSETITSMSTDVSDFDLTFDSYSQNDESQYIDNINNMSENVAERLKFEDTQILEEYCSDILEYLLTAEQKYQPKHIYLQKQTEINALMRTKLIDWLIEVQDEYKLEKETLYLAISYVDRFLSAMFVSRTKLQLLGTTCLFLAAKYEEIYPPDADEFSYVTADTYTKTEVLMMERLILKVFDYRIAVPTTQQYMSIFHQKCNKISEGCKYLSFYFSDLTLLHEIFLRFLPSVKAAAALSLAIVAEHHTVKKNSVDKGDISNAEISREVRETLARYLDQVYACVKEIAKFHFSDEDSNLYARERYCKSDQAYGSSPIVLHSHLKFLSRNEIISPWLR